MKQHALWLLFIYAFLFLSCGRESFETTLQVSLNTGTGGVYSFLPCKVVIKKDFLEDNLIKGFQVVDTFFTDSFGNMNTMVWLGNPKKTEYYYVELIESKWQVPNVSTEKKIIKAGIKNEVEFRVKPKWRHTLFISDSLGKYQPESLHCTHSQMTGFVQKETFENFPIGGSDFVYISAPSNSIIQVQLRVRDRSSNEIKNVLKKYDSENFNDIWLRF